MIVVGKYNWMENVSFMLKRIDVVEYHKCSVPKFKNKLKNRLCCISFHLRLLSRGDWGGGGRIDYA